MKKSKPQPKKYSPPNVGGNVTDKVDRKLLHQFLWKYRDRSNFMSFKPGELAEMLEITIYAMSAIFKDMCEKGYLRKLGNGKYIIIEPSLTVWSDDKTDPNQETMF